jgi:electron transfer DM13
MHGTRSRRFLSLASIPVVVIVVVLGIWATGAVITNNFAVAMWLTVGWMVLTGLVCLAIAARSAALRWPVLAAYVAVAVAAAGYLGSSTLVDDVVDEQVAAAADDATSSAVDAGAKPNRESGRAAPPRNVRLRAGRFEAVRHPAVGTATVIRLAEGGRVLTLTDFDVDNGPDLRVYLVAGPARSEGEVDDFVDLGGLKGNRGNQQYEIPDRVDVDRYATAVIWCRAFSVLFARAPLTE